MGGLLGSISGADSAGSNAQGYSDQAAGQSAAAFQQAITNAATAYTGAEGQIQDSAVNPAATQYIASTTAALQPQFATQNQNQLGYEAQNGTTNSGAARKDFSDLAGAQSGTLAQAISPLYAGIQSSYDSTVQGAASSAARLADEGGAAQTSIYGQGAQNASNAYNNQLGEFTGALGLGAQAAGY